MGWVNCMFENIGVYSDRLWFPRLACWRPTLLVLSALRLLTPVKNPRYLPALWRTGRNLLPWPTVLVPFKSEVLKRQVTRSLKQNECWRSTSWFTSLTYHSVSVKSWASSLYTNRALVYNFQSDILHFWALNFVVRVNVATKHQLPLDEAKSTWLRRLLAPNLGFD